MTARRIISFRVTTHSPPYHKKPALVEIKLRQIYSGGKLLKMKKLQKPETELKSATNPPG